MFASVCILSIIVAWASGENVKTYETLLREGDQHVLSGRANYTSAIAAYTKAIELNAEDTQAFLRRAEVHQLLKNLREAEIDLSTVLEKEPDNKRAVIKKAALHILAGNLSSARLTYEGLLLVWKSENNKKKYDETNLLLNEISDALTAIQEAERDPYGKSLACIIALAPLLQKFPESLELKLKRVECAVNSSNHDLSLSELRKILALNPNSTAAIFLQARELKSLGAIEGAEKHIKRCLTLDPENRSCRNLQKEIKSARKRSEELERFMSQKKWNQVTLLVDSWIQDAETNKNNVLYEQPSISDLKHKQCTAYLELKMVEKGLKACTEVIDRIGHDAPGVWELHILRAELHLLDENISAASEEVELAKRGNENQKKIHDMLAKIEKIKQQMSRKNYYKILGVSKKASKKQIRKAFRELALKYHPDKVVTDDDSERERLAALYRDINEAKEVLFDDEKRKRYDEGEDVMNKQQQQQQQQQDPFAQFMNAGFRFQFH